MKQIVLRVEDSTYEILKNAIPQLKGVQVMKCSDLNEVKKAETGNKKLTGHTLSACEMTFTDRLKAIVRKAALKNGQRVETNVRGHLGVYTFYICEECFCAAISELEEVYMDRLLDFLGGSLWNVDANKVCMFIGCVLKMNIINDKSLQLSDVTFALETYYKASTVKSRMSNKKLSDEEKVLFGTFEGLLKKHNS